MTRTAPAGITAARLTPGMKVRRPGIVNDWRTIANIDRLDGGKKLAIRWVEGAVDDVIVTEPRSRWEEHPDTAGETAERPAHVCDQCGRPSHRCSDCGNEYDRTMHDAYSLHISRAHSRTDQPSSASDAAREKLGLAEGEPAPEVRAAVAEAMSRLRPTAATAGDPDVAKQAVEGVITAKDDPNPVEVVPDTPQAAAARVINQVRAERKASPGPVELKGGKYLFGPAQREQALAASQQVVDEAHNNDGAQQPNDHLEVHLFQPGAAIILTTQDGWNGIQTHLLPQPVIGPLRIADYRQQLRDAEDIFDQVAGWQLTPGSRWELVESVGENQSVAVVARRRITRSNPQ